MDYRRLEQNSWLDNLQTHTSLGFENWAKQNSSRKRKASQTSEESVRYLICRMYTCDAVGTRVINVLCFCCLAHSVKIPFICCLTTEMPQHKHKPQIYILMTHGDLLVTPLLSFFKEKNCTVTWSIVKSGIPNSNVNLTLAHFIFELTSNHISLAFLRRMRGSVKNGWLFLLRFRSKLSRFQYGYH